MLLEEGLGFLLSFSLRFLHVFSVFSVIRVCVSCHVVNVYKEAREA